MLGLPGPVHPLISLMDNTDGQIDLCRLPPSYVAGFYKISFITKLGGKFRYGQGYYDFDEGSLLFTAPNQIMGGTEKYEDNAGYSLIILSIYTIIQEELNSRIDDFSHEVIIAQIELLLSYAKRFYKRQFLTRQVVVNDLLQQLDDLLNTCFEEEKQVHNGVPTVQYLAEQLNFTPNYLSDMLRSLTGLNAQQHIHQKLIERSKELLSTTNLTIGEVAYQLGFEHPQSFSRLFKMKARISPAQFRSAFN